MIRRAYPVSFAFLTARKRRLVAEICRSFRAAVNHYVRLLWSDTEIKSYKDALPPTRLSMHYIDDALRQARTLVSSARKSAAELGVAAGRPFFRGKPILGDNIVKVEIGAGSFDLVLRLATFDKGHKVTLPTKAAAPLRKRLKFEGAYLVQGIALDPDEPILWVASPPPAPKATGEHVAVDVGANVLLADSDGGLHGTAFRAVLDKVRRTKTGSKGRARAYAERDDFVKKTIKDLPWEKVQVLIHEDLKGIKHGKKGGKRLRKLLGPWNQGKVHELLAAKAEDAGVAEVAVDPFCNSITCPKCSSRHKGQRRGSVFKCRNQDCRFTCHADTVGALNALKKARRPDDLVGAAIEQQHKDAAWQRPILIKRAAKAAALSKKTQERGRERALAAKAKKSKLTRPRAATGGRRSTSSTNKALVAPCAIEAAVFGATTPGNVAGEIVRPTLAEGGQPFPVAKSPAAVPERAQRRTDPLTSVTVTSLGPVT